MTDDLETFLQDYLWKEAPLAWDILREHFNAGGRPSTKLEKAYEEMFWAMCDRLEVNTHSVIYNASS